jgi:hypothetical protein
MSVTGPTLLRGMWFGILMCSLAVAAWAGPASVSPLQPNIQWGGRTVAIDVSPANPAVAIAASETGGLFSTADGGKSWSPINSLQPFRMSDVKFAPINPQIVIASAWEDSRTHNAGGIWRSTDGGTTWDKPATSNPEPVDCSVSTPPHPPSDRTSTWGIAVSPAGAQFNQDVYIGTTCGVAVSHDLGATWTHIALAWTQSAVVASDGTVDTCSGDGHHRSMNRGASFSAADAIVPTTDQCAAFGVHAIAASPFERDVLFVATNGRSVLESDDGGVTWTDLSLPPASNRDPWVKTHQSSDGVPTHVDLYAGNGIRTFRQTCTNFGGPGLRCSRNWTQVTVDHDDQNDLAFSTDTNCPKFVASDGGVHTTSDCGANWIRTGGGNGGFNALQLYEVTGTDRPDHTDTYFGTQDNGIWASSDGGATWGLVLSGDASLIQAPHLSPTNADQTVTFYSAPSSNSKFVVSPGGRLSGFGGWTNPPGTLINQPFVIDFLQSTPRGWYIQFSGVQDAAFGAEFALNFTNNFGVPGSWTPITQILQQPVGRPYVSVGLVGGIIREPYVYQPVTKPGGVVGLIYILGVPGLRFGVPTSIPIFFGPADNGLGSIAQFCLSWGTFGCPFVFGVDPNDPGHLIAADLLTNEMKVIHSGELSWQPDAQLTNLVTGGGEFLFSEQTPEYGPIHGSQAHVIAFDPFNGNRILVGTEAAGIIFSLDGGQTWDTVPGSRQIPNITSFYFEYNVFGLFNAVVPLLPRRVLVSSYGRGLWELNLPIDPSDPPPADSARLTQPNSERVAQADSRRRDGRKRREVRPPTAPPYLRLIGTLPISGQAAALPGDTVSAYGSGFCRSHACPPVTLTVGDRIAVEQVPVNGDGTFQATFTITEKPGYYIVTASQAAANNSTLADTAPLIVPVTDAPEEDVQQ